MKHLILLLGMVLLISSCAAMRMGPGSMVAPRFGPVGPKGTSIRIKLQDNCPVSATDFSAGSNVAACQVGTVIKSGRACRDKGDTVTWNANGNGSFSIVFPGSSPMTAAGISCSGNPAGGNYQCTGTLKSDLESETEYHYQVEATGCPALDPYLIVI